MYFSSTNNCNVCTNLFLTKIKHMHTHRHTPILCSFNYYISPLWNSVSSVMLLLAWLLYWVKCKACETYLHLLYCISLHYSFQKLKVSHAYENNGSMLCCSTVFSVHILIRMFPTQRKLYIMYKTSYINFLCTWLNLNCIETVHFVSYK